MTADEQKPVTAPVFSGEAFAAALARAGTEQRWLVVHVTDASNPACWAAVYTTWRDADFVAWLEANAIAIEVDARADGDTAGALGVDAATAPTVLVYRDGKQRARLAGRTSPVEMLKQLERIDIAEDNLVLARKMLKDPARDMMDRDQFADALLRAGLLEDALREYDWLWCHMADVDPDMAGVRVSFMARKVKELCERLPAARARFAELRDAAAATASTNDRPGLQQCIDHAVLNQVLGEDERTLVWFDTLDDEQRRTLPPFLSDAQLPRLLFARERWADAGALIRDPIAELETIHTTSITGRPYRRIAQLHRSLVAAGRHADAAAVREAALRDDDSPAMRAALGLA
jgi:hypothetical protein